MNKTMKHFLGFFTALIMGTSTATAQTDKVVEELNKRGAWTPHVQWIESDERMREYLERMQHFSMRSLRYTLEDLDKDEERADEMLAAQRDIIGKKKGKKAFGQLTKRFKDAAVALRAFESAQAAKGRIQLLRRSINAELKSRDTGTMPGGRLKRFEYHNGNGFAGYHYTVELHRNDNGRGGKLTIHEERMFVPEEQKQEPRTIEVDDSVMQRVRDIVERGELYKVRKDYMPDIDITDASNWSLYFVFEGGTISSGGYAEGPDYGEALNEALKYLNSLMKE